MYATTVYRQIRPSVCLPVCPYVCPFVRHTPVLCQNDVMQRYAVFTVGSLVSSFLRSRMVDGGQPCLGKI